MTQSFENDKKIDGLARQIISYGRNTLFVSMRFMKAALSRLQLVPYKGTIATDAEHLFYDSHFILNSFQNNEELITRQYLHMVLHCIFQHQFVSLSINIPIWDLACDIAVELMIAELDITHIDRRPEKEQAVVINHLRKKVNKLTAEKIYYYYTNCNISESELIHLQKLFHIDDHHIWYHRTIFMSLSGTGEDNGNNSQDNSFSSKGNSFSSKGDSSSDEDNLNSTPELSREQLKESWSKLSQQIQTDLETFSKSQGNEIGSMLQNLMAVNKEKCDYAEFLKKFSVYGEVMKIDDDEFDYNFYTYGLSLYKNMPLIEPLEYKEVKRIKEFVIAIDTSGSVSGELVQSFVQKTYNILKQQESFFEKINIHIVQCDTEIQEDKKITSEEKIDDYIKNMKLHGFGGTDFRPVFEYVDSLIKMGEFSNLKGMIYFTDGYGDFPKQQPNYKTAFVFIDDEDNNPKVPVWAMKVLLNTDEIKEYI